MNIFKLGVNPSNQHRTLVYNVSVQNNGVWDNIFTGKVFVFKNQSIIEIELEDVLWNYTFKGRNYFAPEINSAGDNYVMPTAKENLDEYWYNWVKVEIPETNSILTKNVCFFNDNMFNNRLSKVEKGVVPLFMNFQPIAHIPANLPEGFQYRQIVYNGDFVKNVDETSETKSFNGLGVLTFAGGTEWYGINGVKICKIDSCPAPYYLCWMTNSGAMQVQPFLKSSEVSVNYKNNSRVDSSNFEWLFNQQTRASWKLKSKNLSDKDFKAYGELFASPYLILLDMENFRLHYVNITTETYSQKKNEPNKKPVFFEIEVQSSEIKII